MSIAWISVALTVLFTVLGQYYQKLAADHWSGAVTAEGGAAYRALLRERTVLAAIVCLALAMACWLLALQRLPVSVAYPVLAVNYVVMLLLARWRFREAIPAVRWLGVFCILAGIVLITGGVA